MHDDMGRPQRKDTTKDDISTKESALEALKEKYEDAKAKLEKLAKHEAGDDVITDEEELETLKEGKTTFDETVKNYEKLEKELKDLKSAELETKNKTAAVTKELEELEKKD
uniref:Pneumococcal surface protein A n=1 Tax=Steinernema glaseri TaxID=37863 RepID=A0A1I7YX96_9BILA